MPSLTDRRSEGVGGFLVIRTPLPPTSQVATPFQP